MSFPDLQTLHLYLTVHELGNVTHAAKRHGIAASSVTKRLHDLEEHYGVPFFKRHARGMVPTPAGDKWHAKPATSWLVPTLSKGL